MSSITLRSVKNSPLTNQEVDNNFSALNTDKAEKSITISAGTGLTGGGDLSGNRTLALGNSGVSAGTFGGNNSIPTLTVDAFGRVTAAGTVTPSGTWGISISGNAATATSLSGGTISATNVAYSGTLTGGTGVINIGSGQVYKDASGNFGLGTTPTAKLDVNGTAAISGSLTLSGGTANGVTYLNASKVLTSGSALTFDGSVLTLAPNQITLGSSTIFALGSSSYFKAASTNGFLVNNSADTLNFFKIDTSGNAIFYPAGSEQMRLTSTGLGIGTTSPGAKLDVTVAGANLVQQWVGTSGVYHRIGTAASSFYTVHNGSNDTFLYTQEAAALRLGTAGAERMRITSAGEVNIGSTANYGGLLSINRPQTSSVADLLTLRDGTAGTTFNFQTYADPATGTANRFNWNGTYLAFREGTNERMRIDSSGNLGLGVTSPSVALDIGRDTSANQIKLKASNGNVDLRINSAFGNTDVAAIGVVGAYPLMFFTTNTERLRITSAGNVGIGTSSPATSFYKLTVAGDAGSGAGVQIRSDSGTSGVFGRLAFTRDGTDGTTALIRNSNSDYSLQFWTANGTTNGERMRIDSAGNVGIGTASPLARLSIGSGSIADGNVPIQMNAVASSGEAYIGFNNAGGYGLLVGYDNLRGYASVRNISNTPMAFSTNDIERMRIAADGSVGIGTSSPGAALELARTSADVGLYITRASTGAASYRQFIDGDGDIRLNMVSSKNMRLFTADSERMRISSSGLVMINTTTAYGQFVVNGGGNNSITSRFTGADGASVGFNSIYDSGSGTAYATAFYYNGTSILSGAITYNSVGTTYATSSDYRLKNITGPITDSGAFIDALKPKFGTWKADGSYFAGFLAHEFAEVSPRSVVGEKDAVDQTGKPIYQSMQAASSEVIANVIAELQSLRQRVAALESA